MLRRGSVALAALIVVSTGCASRTEKVVAGDPAGLGATPVTLTGATLITEGDSPRLLLSGNGPLSPTVYGREGSLKVVVDIPNAVATPGLEPPRADGTLLTKVEMKSFSELGSPHIQFEMTSRVRIDARITTETGAPGLTIALARIGPAPTGPRMAEAAAAPAEPEIKVAELTARPPANPPAPGEKAPSGPASAPAKAAPAVGGPAVAALSPSPVSASGEPIPVKHPLVGKNQARKLASVAARSGAGGVSVSLAGDGAFAYETLVLANPPRYVVDLPGVVNGTVKKAYEIPQGPVTRVRVSQFKGGPDPVTRVVFDLATEAVEPAAASSSTGLAFVFGKSAAPTGKARRMEAAAVASGAPEPEVVVATASPAPPAAGSYEKHESDDAAERVVGAAPASAPALPPASAPVAVSEAAVLEAEPPASAPSAAPPASGPAPSASKRVEALAEAPAPAAPPAAPASSASPAPVKAAAAPPALYAPATTDSAPQLVASSPEIRITAPAEKPVPVAPPPPAVKKKKAASPEDHALIEAAEALLVQQDSQARARDLPNPYEARTLGAGDKQYTGEPITLNLKDADIKDTLQRFSELTALNIVLDPDVRGIVTVSLTDIPWDQALELILKINQLGYVLEGSVMRIASTAKLAQEESAKQGFIKAQDQNRPVKTVLQKLSYANAGEIAATAKRVMSSRGDIFIDARSNTLVIKELPDYLPTVLDLIKNLDVANKQVMIETRIVEATRTFSNSIGVSWNFNAVSDAAHGNTTGLVFPNNAAIAGAVALPSGAPQVLSLALGNVLDTFKLDASLHAAESRGLVKIISTPKVQTQTGEQASIQSGFQIPVQTTVNNTTTVLYINATLRLEVTPQITNEGTVIMDITIQKREPAVGINIAGGQNIPLTTRDAKTRLMVKDGGTAVIGGIFKLTTNDGQSMIPGLWKIPVLGALFRQRDKSETSDELMIFITPRVIP